MPIIVTCAKCAKVFRSPEATAGTNVPCPACGMQVPAAGPSVSPFDAFISYSSKDKAVADAAVATLEADGIRCWVAPRDIVPGKEWSESIIQGIADSRMMVLIFSSNANASQQVLREIERAVNRGLSVVPFRIENLMPSRGMEYFISASHWLDAYHSPLDVALQKLSTTCKALLEGQALAPREEPPADLKGKLRLAVRSLAARDHRPKVLAGLALLLVLIGAAIIGGIYAMKPPTANPEVVQAKADAEVVGEKVRSLDPGQGMQPRMDEVANHLNTGQTLFDQKDFSNSQEAFRAAKAKGDAVIEIDRVRSEAKAARTAAQLARSKADVVKDDPVLKEVWAANAVRLAQADEAFNAGDFDAARGRFREIEAADKALIENAGAVTGFRDATKAYETELAKHDSELLALDDPFTWKAIQDRLQSANAAAKAGRFGEAAQTYRDAPADVKALALPRLKYVAHELGGLVLNINLFQQKFYGASNAYTAPRLKTHFEVIESPPFRVLKLPNDLVPKLVAVKSATDFQAVNEAFKKHLIETWGQEVRDAFAVGMSFADYANLFHSTVLNPPNNRVDFDDLKSDVPNLRPVVIKAGYPPFVLKRLDEFAATLPNGTNVFPPPATREAAMRIADLLRYYWLSSSRPFESRYSDAEAIGLFRQAAPAPGSPEAYLHEKGGFYLPEAKDPQHQPIFVQLRTVKIEAADLARIAEMKSVRTIALRGEIPPEALDRLKSMPNLEVLDIHGTATDKHLEHLKGFKLKTLDVSYSDKVTDAGIPFLAEVKTLEILNIRHSGVKGNTMVETLQKLPAMKQLAVYTPSGRGFSTFGSEARADIILALPNVRITSEPR